LTAFNISFNLKQPDFAYARPNYVISKKGDFQMSGKTLPVVFFTLVCTASGFGQQNETPKKQVEKPSTGTQISAERVAEMQKKREIEFRGIHGTPDLLGKFIPAGADAWGVKIETTGGFTGKGLPTVTVFSDGDVFVEHKSTPESNVDPSVQRRLSSDVLQKISEIVTNETLTEKVKNGLETTERAQKETSYLCSDCYQTSITIVRRDANGEIRYFSNREKNILFSTGDFNRIYQIIKENTGVLN
jgi:hypothetical protein